MAEIQSRVLARAVATATRDALARRESIALLHGSEAAEVMKYEDGLVPVRGPNAWRALRDQEAHALPVPRIVIDVIVIPPPSLAVTVPLPAAFPFILPPYPPGRHRALEVHQLDPAVWADSPPGEGHSEGWNPFIPEEGLRDLRRGHSPPFPRSPHSKKAWR